VLDTITVSPTPTPAMFPLAERDEYGPILGRPGGLFTAPPAVIVTGEREPVERPPASWVPPEHLL
jgi:hypothetical protein